MVLSQSAGTAAEPCLCPQISVAECAPSFLCINLRGFQSFAEKHIVVMMKMTLCMLSYATDGNLPHLNCKSPEMVSLQSRLPLIIRCTACAAGLLSPIQKQKAVIVAMQTRHLMSHKSSHRMQESTSEPSIRAALCCRRTKAQHIVDFENLPELPDNAFELAPHKEISLKSMPAVNTLLPPDHHYKVCRSCCLSSCQQPSVDCRVKSCLLAGMHVYCC